MARPAKPGLDYFPKNVDFYHNQTNRIICNELGLTALIFYDFLLCYIYEKKGYYAEADRLLWSVINDNLKLDRAESERLLNSLIEYNIFDKAMYEKYSILTSAEIQKVYIAAKKKKASVLHTDYSLLEPEKDEENSIEENKAENNEILLRETATKKSKEKKSKVKKSKVNQQLQLLKKRAAEKAADAAEERADDDSGADKDRDLNTAVKLLEKNICPANPVITEKIKRWLDKLDISVICEVIEDAAVHGGKTWKYVDTILAERCKSAKRHPPCADNDIDEELGF